MWSLLNNPSTNTCLINLYSVSMVSSCFIYKLEKLSDQQFKWSFHNFPLWKFRAENPMCLEFQTQLPSPPLQCLQNSSSRTPTPPSKFHDPASGMLWIFFWKHSMERSLGLKKTLSSNLLFGQAAPKFCLPWVSLSHSQLSFLFSW